MGLILNQLDQGRCQCMQLGLQTTATLNPR
uniref:Uncharacterized protein n=1 Tax=Rhizophora mucronata TaxID=61149 RepID=A0A2P2IIB6_RHIMU